MEDGLPRFKIQPSKHQDGPSSFDMGAIRIKLRAESIWNKFNAESRKCWHNELEMRWRMKRSWKPSCLNLQYEKMLVSRLKLQVLISVNTWKPVWRAKGIQLSKASQGTTPI